jgi:hypothetical protein
MFEHTLGRGPRLGIYVAAAAGVIAAALAGSPLASADDSPLSVDGSALADLGGLDCTQVCGDTFGPFLPYFPFEFTQELAPATGYSSVGDFYAPDGLADATGFDIVSGNTSFLSEFTGVAGETVLYTLNDGVASAPIELLPFDLPL